MFQSRTSADATEKLLDSGDVKTNIAWSYDMAGHAKKCRSTATWQKNNIEQLYEVSTLCIDDHQLEMEELEAVGELPIFCFRIFLKCMYLSRIDRSAILWSVHKLARAVTKWTRACDRRFARSISYIQNASGYRWEGVLNTADCRLKINIGRYFMHLRESDARSNQLDVQETNCSFTQFNRI